MSSGNIWKTLFDQFANVMNLVREGKRTAEFVSRVLQAIIGDDEIAISPKQASVPPPPPKPPELKVWKTVKLGTGLKTAADFRIALKKAGYKIGDWADDGLGTDAFAATVATKETVVELVRVTVAELGFQNGARRDEIYARALGFGLGKCSAEVGPQLRLQYVDQPLGEWIRVGMEPIAGSGGTAALFNVGHDGDGQYLFGDDGGADNVWHGVSQWVFARVN